MMSAGVPRAVSAYGLSAYRPPSCSPTKRTNSLSKGILPDLLPHYQLPTCSKNTLTHPSLQKSSFRYQDILQELPLQIHNSHLLTSFLHTLPTSNTTTPPKIPNSLSELPPTHNLPSPLYPNLSTLTLSIDPFLSQTSDLLLEAIESHHTELNNHQFYQRSLAREQAKITAWQQKRKAENASRVLTKQTPLPEDEWQRLFKLPTEPSRLEGMLNSRQVEQYARQVDGFAAGVTGKMFAVRSNLLPEKME